MPIPHPPRPPEVQFYWHDQELEQRISARAQTCWADGGSIVLVATPGHLELLQRRLPRSSSRQRLIAIDAVRLLGRGHDKEGSAHEPNLAAMRQVLQRAGNAAPGPVFLFCEQAALLWAERRREDAVQVGAVWHQLARQLKLAPRIELMSAFPMSWFEHLEDGTAFLRICAGHSAVLPAASEPSAVRTAAAMRSA